MQQARDISTGISADIAGLIKTVLDRRIRKVIGTAAIFAGVAVLLIMVLFPILWMVSTSFKVEEATFNMPPEWIPRAPTLENYKSFFTSGSMFLTWVKNSTIVCAATVFAALTFGSMAAYALSRYNFRWTGPVMLFFVFTQMIPFTLLLLPEYVLFSKLKLLNTYLGLTLAYTPIALPLTIWILKGFFDGIPRELEEAAYVDGCGRVRALISVVLPLSGPGLLSAGIYVLLMAWQEFIFGLTLMGRPEMRTLIAGMYMTFHADLRVYYGPMMAGAVLMSLPVVIAYIFLQRYLIQGLMAGALKG